MPLNTEMTGTVYAVDHHDDPCWGDLKYTVASLMMMCGMQRVKDAADVEEFEWRLRVYSKAFGNWLSTGDDGEEAFYLSIPSMVGTWTNVSRVSRATWFNNVKRNWAMEVSSAATRASKVTMYTEVSA